MLKYKTVDLKMSYQLQLYQEVLTNYELLKIIKNTCAFVDKSVSAPASFTRFDSVKSRVPEISEALFVEGSKRVQYVRWICYNFVKKIFAPALSFSALA